MAQDVFQMWMDQITERLPGIIAIHNDICVFGKTQEQHNKHLLQATVNSISKRTSLQQQKMSDKQATDHIFGTIFSAKGMKPDPIKIQAFQDLPTPQTQKQLQSFLGLVNYLQTFLPDIAAKTTFLREQVSKWDLDTPLQTVHFNSWSNGSVKLSWKTALALLWQNSTTNHTNWC